MDGVQNQQISLTQKLPMLLRIRLVFEAEDLIAPPAALGAMWRGVLGRALKFEAPEAYERLFQPKAPNGVKLATGNMPSAFVLDPDPLPDLVAAPGEQLTLDVTLLGDAIEEAGTVVTAFEQAGQAGLGKTRGRATLVAAGTVWSVEEDGGPYRPYVPPRPELAMIVLRSPWQSGKEITHKNFRIRTFLRAVQRRVSEVSKVYGGGSFASAPITAPDVRHLQLWPVAFTRWSARLDVEDDMSGTLGSFELVLPDDDDLWAALWAAQWLHIGRKASFGLGAVRVHPVLR